MNRRFSLAVLGAAGVVGIASLFTFAAAIRSGVDHHTSAARPEGVAMSKSSQAVEAAGATSSATPEHGVTGYAERAAFKGSDGADVAVFTGLAATGNPQVDGKLCVGLTAHGASALSCGGPLIPDGLARIQEMTVAGHVYTGGLVNSRAAALRIDTLDGRTVAANPVNGAFAYEGRIAAVKVFDSDGGVLGAVDVNAR